MREGLTITSSYYSRCYILYHEGVHAEMARHLISFLQAERGCCVRILSKMSSKGDDIAHDEAIYVTLYRESDCRVSTI